MATVTGKSIIDRAVVQLVDKTAVRWTREELLSWVNDAQRTIVQIKPDANAVTKAVKLVAGVKQRIPDDGWLFLDLYYTLGRSGDKPGRVVRNTSRAALDAVNPRWMAAKPVVEPVNFVFDAQDPETFFVYPPADGTGYVELSYSAVPTDLASEDDKLGISDLYQTAILDYVLFRACSKDADYAPGVALSQYYFQLFAAALGIQSSAETENSPNHQLRPHDPAIPGSVS